MNYDELLGKVERELRLRNYSIKTIKSYLGCLLGYFWYVKKIRGEPNVELIKDYLLGKQTRGQSSQTINLHLNAIRYFYREIIKSRTRIDLKLAKRSKNLPVVLSKKEIKKIIGSIKNEKHRLLIALAYGGGLRVSEAVNLRVGEVDLEELTVHIKNGKGKKDRMTVFSESLKIEMAKITKGKMSHDPFFESKRGGKLTERSAQKVFKKALREAGINKEATFHSLRHSFATHLLENGVNIRYIQELLGHANIRTTQIYTQVTGLKLKNIKSPL